MSLLITRNLKLYFRDHMAVFFSMMSVFISITLYVLFLSDTISSGGMEELTNGKTILNLWLLSGLMGMSSVTTTLAAYDTMMEDRISGKEKDFFVSSMPRFRLAASYIISAVIIGITMVSITLLLGIGYFYFANGVTITPYQIGASLLVSLGNVAASATVFFPIVQSLKSRGSYSSFGTLLGTLVGFLMGVYIPIGALPSFAQVLIKIFPMTHGTALIRSLFTHDMIQEAIPFADIVTELENQLGITLSFGDHIMSVTEHCLVLGVTILLFGILSLWCYRHHKQK